MYFLSNRRNRTDLLKARFRVSGKVPQLWDAQTGLSKPVAYRIEAGHTVVPLEMAGDDAVFVVFRQPAHAAAVDFAPVRWAPVATITDPWEVTFQPDRGAPASVTIDWLASLSANADPRVRYFSGVARYRNHFDLPADYSAAQSLKRNLGAVGDVAEVWVSGALTGTACRPPYRLDISAALVEGRNEIEIRVANLWVNRLIGDAQSGAERIGAEVSPGYQANAPLRPDGLIGPGQLMATEGAAGQ